MNYVVDTSAVLAVVINESTRDRLIEVTREADLLAPASLHWEIGNAFSAMFKQRRVTVEQAVAAVQTYERIPIRLIDVSLGATLRLSHRLKIYAYDAYVIACALQHRCPLITLDRELQVAAREAGAKVLEIN
jgi:predicted nucleic acid-binding protein